MASAHLATWILARLRKRRVRFRSNIKLLSFGAIYQGKYNNYKTDPNPLIWCQYCNPEYTHGININRLGSTDRQWLLNIIYLIKKGKQVIDPLTMYKLIKLRRATILRTAYRVYFTRYLKMRLVSAGITKLNTLTYRSENGWVNNLNKLISPQNVEGGAPISYSIRELSQRINEAHNVDSITQQTSGEEGSFRRAVYLDQSPV